MAQEESTFVPITIVSSNCSIDFSQLSILSIEMDNLVEHLERLRRQLRSNIEQPIDIDTINPLISEVHQAMYSVTDRLSTISGMINNIQNNIWRMLPTLQIATVATIVDKDVSGQIEKAASSIESFTIQCTEFSKQIEQLQTSTSSIKETSTTTAEKGQETAGSETTDIGLTITEHGDDTAPMMHPDQQSDQEKKQEQQQDSTEKHFESDDSEEGTPVTKVACEDQSDTDNDEESDDDVVICKEGIGCFRPKGQHKYSGGPCTICKEWLHRLCATKKESETDLICLSCYVKHSNSSYRSEPGGKKWVAQKKVVDSQTSETMARPFGLLPFDPKDPTTYVHAIANVRLYQIKMINPDDSMDQYMVRRLEVLNSLNIEASSLHSVSKKASTLPLLSSSSSRKRKIIRPVVQSPGSPRTKKQNIGVRTSSAC